MVHSWQGEVVFPQAMQGPLSNAPSAVSSLVVVARVRKLHGGIAGLSASFVRTISTWKQDMAIPRGKADAEVLPGVGARVLQSGLIVEACLSANQASHTAVVPASNIVHMKPMQRSHIGLARHFSVRADQSKGAVCHSLMTGARRFNQCILEGHNVFRPDTEHLCMSSLHSRPSRCNCTSCRSFALLLRKLLVQLLLHEILNKKLESNLSDIVLVLGCLTAIIPSTIGMRIISALRGSRSGLSVIPLANHLRTLHVYAQPSWLRVRVSLPFDIAGRFCCIHVCIIARRRALRSTAACDKSRTAAPSTTRGCQSTSTPPTVLLSGGLSLLLPFRCVHIVDLLSRQGAFVLTKVSHADVCDIDTSFDD